MTLTHGWKRWRRRFLWIAGVSAAGLIVAWLSWQWRDASPWWSSLLSNAAVGFFLLVPGELVLGRIRRVGKATEEARGVAIDARETAAAALQAANDAAQSLSDIEDRLVQRQVAALNVEKDVYRKVKANLTRASLIEALRHARNEDLISDAGVRSPVWETDLHYRYLVENEESALVVQLENDDGTVLSSHSWASETSPDDFFQQLVGAVRAAGRDLGTALNVPTQSIAELMDMLVDVTDLRSQELAGHRNTLRKIIERVGGWYFTENYVIPADHLSYTIEVTRLDDPIGEEGWERHLVLRGWHSAEFMIPFARRLYHAKGKKSPPWELARTSM